MGHERMHKKQVNGENIMEEGEKKTTLISRIG